MAIKSITIENFKGIGDAVTIPIRPITLLFGKNSSGKSTVLQALLYMSHVIKYEDPDPYSTDIDRGYIDLGGFYSLVHRHELDRNIRIRIEFGGQDLERFYEAEGPFLKGLRDPIRRDLYGYLKSVWIEVVTGWNAEKDYTEVLSLSLGLNGIEWYCKTNKRPEIFPSINTIGSNRTQWVSNHGRYDGTNYYNIEHPIIIDNVDNKMKQNILLALTTRKLAKDLDPLLASIRHSYYSIRDKLIKIGVSVSTSIRYLGPIRKLPPRNFAPQKTPNESKWATGLEAWNILGRERKSLMIESINYYMKDILKLGYTIKRKEYILLDIDSKIMKNMEESDSINRLKELPRQVRLKLHSEKNDVDLDPLDVGLGISQVIPVLVGIKNFATKNIFAVENPEIHLHPAAQVALGDVFIDSKNPNNTLLIETHSEHLLLRLLRRVRETNVRISEKYDKLVRERRQNSINPIDEDEMLELDIRSRESEHPYHHLEPDDLSIVYVMPTSEEVKLTLFTVTGDGDFEELWPEGFFEERMEELF